MKPTRRSMIRFGGALALAAISTPSVAAVIRPAGSAGKNIRLDHLHTAERIGLVFAIGEDYLERALSKLNYFLRDHYTHEVGQMDPMLYDLMHRIQKDLGAAGSFEVISGYRSPKTNEHLRQTRGGGVAKTSLHMQGKAIDVRLPSVPLKELRDAAVAQNAGGVGYYPKDGFVHIDTGRVRSW
jgi:uncharacterized protein YcbK (DUF882 family)